MFYLIGLGLGDEKDISVKGLEAVRRCHYVYLESYTSVLPHMVDSDVVEQAEMDSEAATSKTHDHDHDDEEEAEQQEENLPLEEQSGFKKALEKLKAFYDCQNIQVAARYHVEGAFIGTDDAAGTGKDHASSSQSTFGVMDLSLAKTQDMALLVVGDPLSATTHTDLLLRCQQHAIPYQVIHNTSIMTAIGMTGLSLYQFTPTLSIPFFTDAWKPMSFYEKLATFRGNQFSGDKTTSLNGGETVLPKYHTLCLLDIKVKEPTLEEIARGRSIPRHFLPPRFMTVHDAIDQLLECEKTLQLGLLSLDSMAIGCARLGSPQAVIQYGTLRELREFDFGPPLHSFILPAHPTHLHDLERDMLNTFRI